MRDDDAHRTLVALSGEVGDAGIRAQVWGGTRARAVARPHGVSVQRAAAALRIPRPARPRYCFGGERHADGRYAGERRGRPIPARPSSFAVANPTTCAANV